MRLKRNKRTKSSVLKSPGYYGDCLKLIVVIPSTQAGYSRLSQVGKHIHATASCGQ